MRKFILLILVTLLLFGCKKSEIKSDISFEEDSAKIFRAVFFLEGDLAKKIHVYSSTIDMLEKKEKEDKSLASKRKVISDKIFNKIKKDNPQIIKDFYLSIKSKNINNIDESVNTTSAYLASVLDSEFKNELGAEGQLVSGPCEQCLTGPGVVAWALWEVALAVNVGIAVTVYVWKYGEFWPAAPCEELPTIEELEAKGAKMTKNTKSYLLKKDMFLLSLSNIVE